MKYKELTFWQNKKRQKLLTQFISQIEAYFNKIDFDSYNIEPIENDESLKIRSWLNKKIGIINRIVFEADVSPVVTWTPPPSTGGYIQKISIIENFPLLSQYNISPIEIKDVLEKALGVYEEDFLRSVIRSLDPLFWVGKLIRWIAAAPFRFLNSLGLPGAIFEKSMGGKLVKEIIQFILWVITITVTIWGFLIIFGIIKSTDTIHNFFPSK